MISDKLKKETLELLYRRYNRRECISPDPLEAVYRYETAEGREIAGLVAASLAFGAVRQILKSVSEVLSGMGSPRAYLERATPLEVADRFASFRHRYVTGRELSAMLVGAKRVIARHGSLGACFAAATLAEDDTVIPALQRFVAELRGGAQAGNYLIPCPSMGSACKRWFMYLRWMIRRDAVDPGCWKGISPSRLVVPLDTHMWRFAQRFGFTSRSQPDLKAALEVTAAFRTFAPEDPVRYDFALTRLGIREKTSAEEALDALQLTGARAKSMGKNSP